MTPLDREFRYNVLRCNEKVYFESEGTVCRNDISVSDTLHFCQFNSL